MNDGLDPYRPPRARLGPEERRRHALALLDRAGVPRSLSAPPAWRALWRAGLDLPPPPFMARWALALAFGLPFAAIWGVATWALQWRTLGLHWSVAVLVAVGAGAAFGVLLSGVIRRRTGFLALPRWKDLGRPARAEREARSS